MIGGGGERVDGDLRLAFELGTSRKEGPAARDLVGEPRAPFLFVPRRVTPPGVPARLQQAVERELVTRLFWRRSSATKWNPKART